MSNITQMPKKIIGKDIELIRIFPEKDNKRLEDLLIIYNVNREHLSLWHHEWNELLFDSIDAIKEHLKKNRFFCYALYFSGKIIGCIEISHLSTINENMKYRILTYWIDKDNSRKGIMYNTLLLIEKKLFEKKLDFLMTEVDADNEPSIKLMKKLNYKLFSVSWQISENGETMVHFKTYRKLNDRGVL